MRFWDSSALVPLLVEESTSGAMARVYRDDRSILVAWTTPIECVSACMRKHRMKQLDQTDLISIVQRIRDLCGEWIIAEPTRGLADEAERLVLRHGLCAADGIQLASAVATSFSSGGEMVSLDRRLAEAAMIEGFRIIPGRE